MQRIIVFFVIALGIGLFLGIDLWPFLGSFLLVILVSNGILMMLGGRLPRRGFEAFLIFLVGPLFVSLVIHSIVDFIHNLFLQIGIHVSPGVIFGFILLLIGIAFIWIWVRRNQNRSNLSFRLRGAERKPVVPGGMSDRNQQVFDDDNMLY